MGVRLLAVPRELLRLKPPIESGNGNNALRAEQAPVCSDSSSKRAGKIKLAAP